MSRRPIPPPQGFILAVADCSLLQADETIFLNLPNQGRRFLAHDHHHNGAPSDRFYYRYGVNGLMMFDSWDQNQRLPQRNRQYAVDEALVFDSFDQNLSGDRGEGLSEDTIAKHVKIRSHQASCDDDGGVCVVCQDDLFQENRIGRLRCGHEYHPHCIKKWLMINNTCPICKATAIPPS